MTSLLGITSAALCVVATWYCDFEVGAVFLVGAVFFGWEIYNGRDVAGVER